MSEAKNEVHKREFNYGIEALRIVSMLMVVMLHVLGQGGVLANLGQCSAQYHLAWILEIVCYCAVNCYGLITGFVMFESEFKYRKIVPLWLQIMFYSVGITFAFYIIMPSQVSMDIVIRGFFPILSKSWWYVSSYIGMYFFIPFLNFLVREIKREESLKLGATLIIVFSIMGTSTWAIWGDAFGTQNGYTLLWLTVLYLLGAIIKKNKMELEGIFECKRNCKKLIGITGIALIMITVLFHNGFAYLPDEFPRKAELQSTLINYISPTILGFALCLLIVFSFMKIEIEWLKKPIKKIGKLTFGVYLIHVHPLIWNIIIKDRFVMFATMPVLKMILYILGVVLMIFIICIFVEAIRQKLFKILNIKRYI